MTDIDPAARDAIDAALGRPRKCKHPGRHTVYGAKNPKDNGTTCVLCGEKIRAR